MSEQDKNDVLSGLESGELGLIVPQPRWKSWALWVSVLGALWTIANAFGLPEKWGIQESTFKTVVDAIGVILIGFGILNSPKDKANF
jgi:uncharacterized membrane protein